MKLGKLSNSNRFRHSRFRFVFFFFPMHEEFWYFQFNLMFLEVGFLGELKFILIYFIDAANVKIKFLKR